MSFALLLMVVGCACGLQLVDIQAQATMEMESPTSPLSQPFNITNVSLTLPLGNWQSCRMDDNNRFKVVLVTMVKSPCTVQDWLTMCENYQCAGVILHTLYDVPGLVLSHRIDRTAIVEVSNLDGLDINNMLSAGRQLYVSMDSSEVNQWVQYFESREFIWVMTMPSSAAACIGALNFFKIKEKMGGVFTWRSIPIMHIVLVMAESIELGFRRLIANSFSMAFFNKKQCSALGFGLGATQGTGFSFEYFIMLINLVIMIYTLSNLTLGLALRDMYSTLMKQRPPLNNYVKVLTFIFCTVIFVLQYIYNIIPRKTGNGQWRLPIIGHIWTAVVIGTVALFLIFAVKLSISFRKIQVDREDNNWILKRVSIRLLQCAMAMSLDLIILSVIALWTYHSSPRLLLISISLVGWTQNLTSIFKMRAILVPTLPNKRRQNIILVKNDDEDRSSKYLPTSIDEECFHDL